MSNLDDQMTVISKRIAEQSVVLARIVDESNLLRTCSQKLMQKLRAHLSEIKLELDNPGTQNGRDRDEQ